MCEQNNKNSNNNKNAHMDNSNSGTFGPPFLTLEETESQPPPTTTTTITISTNDRNNNSSRHKRSISNNNDDDDDDDDHNRRGGHDDYYTLLNDWWKKLTKLQRNTKIPEINGKHVVSLIMSCLVALVIFDTLFVSPEHRWIKPESSNDFLRWVQAHPYQGLGALIGVIAIAVVLMIPVGTPLTLGCGYIYKGTYGWGVGVTIATIVSMAGSAVGAIICFLLGRYLMRDQVRKWVRKYPLFDAIDAATAEHGLRIMAMLYLTPILPLGPVSYMCGTTSMPLSSFVLAKVASLPLMLLYVFIGASTGALISDKKKNKGNEDVAKQIEQNQMLIVSGILLSVVMIVGISYYIKKELYKTLERQKKLKPGEKEDDSVIGGDTSTALTAEEGNMELGTATSRKRRHVVVPTSTTTEDVDGGES